VLYPLISPRQPIINAVGGAAFYVLVLVVVTSHYRRRMKRSDWKLIHLSVYAMAALFLVHGVLSDQTLKDKPVDYLDGEKVAIEACGLALVAATAARVRIELKQRAARAATAARRERERQAA